MKDRRPLILAAIVGIVFLTGSGVSFITALNREAAKQPEPTVVGLATETTKDSTNRFVQFVTINDTRSARYPMWVQTYEGCTNAMWGFIQLTNVSDVKGLLERYRIVRAGNFADQKYARGTLPIYVGAAGFWDPHSQYGIITSDTPPAQFLLAVWLNDPNRYQ